MRFWKYRVVEVLTFLPTGFARMNEERKLYLEDLAKVYRSMLKEHDCPVLKTFLAKLEYEILQLNNAIIKTTDQGASKKH